jgi:hypothetical protein
VCGCSSLVLFLKGKLRKGRDQQRDEYGKSRQASLVASRVNDTAWAVAGQTVLCRAKEVSYQHCRARQRS